MRVEKAVKRIKKEKAVRLQVDGVVKLMEQLNRKGERGWGGQRLVCWVLLCVGWVVLAFWET